MFDGLSELLPVSVKSLVDLLVGEVFPPVLCVFFNNNDRSLVSLSYDKELFLSLECGECSRILGLRLSLLGFSGLCLMTKKRISLNFAMNRSSTELSVLPGLYPIFR